MFTEQQLKALDFRRHLSVTANAGAGKTTVLVQRFVEILRQTNVRLSEIVAITFTEKAAGELRKKILRKIQEEIAGSTSSAGRKRFEQLRDQLPSAAICTIHSFCARMLREYPVEADVDAAFTVVEGIDRGMLEAEAVRETLGNIMTGSAEPGERDALLSLVRQLGRATLEQYIRLLMSKREILERLATGVLSQSRTDADILESWTELLASEVEAMLTGRDWFDSLSKTLAFANGPSSGKVKELARRWDPERDSSGMIALYSEIAALVFTRASSLRKQFIGDGAKSPGVSGAIERLQAFHSDLGDLIRDLNEPRALEYDRLLLHSQRDLLRITHRIIEAYDARKSEHGLLDFEDLQLKVRSLLLNPVTGSRIARKYSYIMVDEFQDTNGLQYEILHMLVEGLSGGNLFIVGDPKQSIYGFRNAEVEVFNRAKDDILGASASQYPFFEGRAELASTAEERSGRLILSESFRPLPNIVSFVNRVFSRLAMSASSASDLHYDELIQGRSDGGEGGVELCLVPVSDDSPMNGGMTRDDALGIECRMIADRIVELKRSNLQVGDKESEGMQRNLEYRDIAILLRDRRHADTIERALAGRGIPFVLSGGMGFYQTQEVNDFLSYLKFLVNHKDDVSLAGILRSPFFAVSDADLYESVIVGKGDTFWEKVQSFASRESAPRALKRAAEFLSEDLEHINRVSIPALIHEISLRTGWQGILNSLDAGRQRLANIQKLLRSAREFESRGFTTAYDFVERLSILVQQLEREGQAPLEPPKNCVQVMTIHAAKGLEFPVVVIPFTHQPFRYDPPPYIDPRVGLGFNLPHGSGAEGGPTAPMYQFLRRRSVVKTENEECRVFYVACTRARDLLVLSGQTGPKLPLPSYLSWVRTALGDEIHFEQEGEQVCPPSPVRVLKREHGSFQVTTTERRLSVRVRHPGDSQPAHEDLSVGESESFSPIETMVEVVPGESAGEFFSATHIRTYLECPSKYYLKYCLGIPEQHSHSWNNEDTDEESDHSFGDAEGIITHAVLQDIHSPAVRPAELREQARRIVDAQRANPEPQVERFLDVVTTNVLNFVNSSFGTEVLSATESKTEFTINSVFMDDFLIGTIDRLYKDPVGRWNIVDYKTDRIDIGDVELRAAKYKPQLAFYSLLVSKLFGQEAVKGSVVFLRHPSNPVQFEFGPAELVDYQKTLNIVINSIKAGRFDRKEEMCAMCPYGHETTCMAPRIGPN